jgi:hypothetical protein
VFGRRLGLGRGFGCGPEHHAGAKAATKADEGEKDWKKLAHDQNGSAVSAICWP